MSAKKPNESWPWIILLLFCLFGLMGTMDYVDEVKSACARGEAAACKELEKL